LAAVLAAAVLAAGLLAAGCAGSASPTDPRNGVWEGSGRGWGGEIRVRLRLGSSLIQGLEVVSHQEDPIIGGEAMAELLELVLDYQDTSLDAVTGATETSAGFLAAVEDALNRAASVP
jgi:fumarate reductase flavoprotein subunit